MTLCESRVGWQTAVGRCEHGKSHPRLMSCDSHVSCHSNSRHTNKKLILYSYMLFYSLGRDLAVVAVQV